ncbi:MAG: hypothetical protein QOK10_3743 [Pseudonocardiales bacterium]|nr:hypothetical protein [Pseudonocardiales bacterium]
MPRRDPAPSRNGWRITAIVVSAALGLAAICLVVFSQTAKQSQIGVLLGAWAVFIAAPTFFGNRRAQQHAVQLREAQQHAIMLHDAQLQIARLQESQVQAATEAQESQDIELRRFGELQLARETAARREADLRLEVALRGEIERVLTDQLGALRDEVSSLRAEVLDKLGGQLRLERIETTRVIASDLEALQSEIRRLGGSRENLAAPAEPSASREQSITYETSVAPGRPERAPAPAEDDILDAEVIEQEPQSPRPAAAEPVQPPQPVQRAEQVQAERVAPPQPEGATSQPLRPEPERPQSAPVQPERVAPEPVQAEGAAASQPASPEPERRPVDPFAGLPRLSPLPPEFADLIDPIIVPKSAVAPAAAEQPPANASASADANAGANANANANADDADTHGSGTAGRPGQSSDNRDWTAGRQRYVGRRRAAGEADGEPEPSGGRRRAPEEAPDDVLARIRLP